MLITLCSTSQLFSLVTLISTAGVCDPYVEVEVFGETQQTTVHKARNSCYFDDMFFFIKKDVGKDFLKVQVTMDADAPCDHVVCLGAMLPSGAMLPCHYTGDCSCTAIAGISAPRTAPGAPLRCVLPAIASILFPAQTIKMRVWDNDLLTFDDIGLCTTQGHVRVCTSSSILVVPVPFSVQLPVSTPR